MERLEALAEFSVARGSGFAMLAIFTAMIGLFNDPPLMLKVGAVLSLLACMALVLKAALAERTSYRSTELWIMLKPEERPRAEIAQRLVGRVLRRAYLRFALYFACGAGAMLVSVVVLALTRGGNLR
jgi:hypothetical protein